MYLNLFPLQVNSPLAEVEEWVNERVGQSIQAGPATGVLHHFIIEPFLAHKPEEEYYICIHSHRWGEDWSVDSQPGQIIICFIPLKFLNWIKFITFSSQKRWHDSVYSRGRRWCGRRRCQSSQTRIRNRWNALFGRYQGQATHQRKQGITYMYMKTGLFFLGVGFQSGSSSMLI